MTHAQVCHGARVLGLVVAGLVVGAAFAHNERSRAVLVCLALTGPAYLAVVRYVARRASNFILRSISCGLIASTLGIAVLPFLDLLDGTTGGLTAQLRLAWGVLVGIAALFVGATVPAVLSWLDTQRPVPFALAVDPDAGPVPAALPATARVPWIVIGVAAGVLAISAVAPGYAPHGRAALFVCLALLGPAYVVAITRLRAGRWSRTGVCAGCGLLASTIAVVTLPWISGVTGTAVGTSRDVACALALVAIVAFAAGGSLAGVILWLRGLRETVPFAAPVEADEPRDSDRPKPPPLRTLP